MDKEINNRQVDVCRPDLEGKLVLRNCMGRRTSW